MSEEPKYFINKIQSYVKGHPGIFEVKSDTELGLLLGVNKLYLEYPMEAYGSFITEIKQTTNGRFFTYFKHWGSND